MTAFTWDTDTSTGNDPADFAAITKDSITDLLTSHLGTSAPAAFADGVFWLDSTTSTRYIPKFGQNSGTGILIGYDASASTHIAFANLDMDQNQMLNMRIEQLATGSLTAASAGAEGQLEWDITQGRLKLTGDTNNHYAAQCRTDASTNQRIEMRMHVASLGTPATASTDTEFGGWTLDAAADELCLVARVPSGWTAAEDLNIDVHCLLLAAETASDLIHMDGVWISATPGSGDSASKTETGFAAVSPSIGSANAQYDIHTVTLVVDHDDATNPVAAGDWIRATINHDVAGATPVAGVIVIGADLVVPCFNLDQ